MSRSRASAARAVDRTLEDRRRIRAASGASSSITGAAAAAVWLRDRGTVPPPAIQHWYVEIAIGTGRDRPATDFDETTATRLHLDIYAEEWGIYFCHHGRASWIRITDVAFVHGRDEFRLIERIPPLAEIGELVRELEREHDVKLQRQDAAVRTNLAGAELAIRAWIATL